LLLPNDIIGQKYTLIKRLDPGGMGDVWLAEDTILKRKIAIKTIRPNLLASNPGALSIFKDEAIVGASLLGHPNVVAVLDYDMHLNAQGEEEYYMVMEFVEGINIELFINKYKPLIDEETYYYLSVFIAMEIVKAITYAQKHNILHRDIKPLNVFLSKYGITKVGDFGLARFVDAVTRTHTVSQFISHPYTAPEQWRDEAYTYKTDIYQLGCTLFQLFTGRFLFDKRNMAAQMHAHLVETPISPKSLNKYLSDSLSDHILKMVSKDSKKRGELWQLYNLLVGELQKKYDLVIDTPSDKQLLKKIDKITDFDVEDWEEGESHTYEFLDFHEVLSEGIELLLNGITDFTIHPVNEEEEKEEEEEELSTI